MLMPKKTKYRKMFKGRIKGKAHKGNTVVYGDFGLVSVGKAKITSRQIEAARIEIGGVDEALAREAFRRAAHKLPVKCKVITKAAAEEVK